MANLNFEFVTMENLWSVFLNVMANKERFTGISSRTTALKPKTVLRYAQL